MGKHLDFYMQSMQNDEHMPVNVNGLCTASDIGLIDKDAFEFLKPTRADINCLIREGLLPADARTGYWAAGIAVDDPQRSHGFTPLRQTIVLFMAAINNEL